MSAFSQYLSLKKIKPIISLEKYQESLEREIYDIFLDADNRHLYVLENLLETTDLSIYLEGYPKKDEVLMALAALDIQRLCKFKDLPPIAEKIVFECKSYFFGKQPDFSKETVEKIINKKLAEIQDEMTKISGLLVEFFDNFNGTIFSCAISPVTITEAEVKVNNVATFTARRMGNRLIFSELQTNEQCPASLKRYLLAETPSQLKPLTLYAAIPPFLRPEFETYRRELALGRKMTLPVELQLKEEIPEYYGIDVWRLKVDRRGLLQEQNYYLASKETSVCWLDLIRKAENET